MGYLSIPNLYKNTEIMLFKRCFALEKIHGTNSYITWDIDKLTFFSGGEKHERFVSLFNEDELKEKCKETGLTAFTVFGEAYGGKQQGQSHRYGKDLKFICFDVKIGDVWISVPQAERFCLNLGLEFVDYVEIDTDIAEIDAQRDRPSTQAIRNGCGEHAREGVVLRPLIEVTKNNGDRIIVKHKGDEFKETKTPRNVDPEKMQILEEANAVADEWVTLNRLNNIISHLPGDLDVTKTGNYIKLMIEDVRREGGEEVIMSKSVEKAIGKKTAQLIKLTLQGKLHE